MDINELLGRTWRITREHKTLWGFGFVSVLFGFMLLPLIFLPVIGLFSEQTLAWMENPLAWLIWGLAVVVTYGMIIVVSTFTRGALVLGVHRAERAAGRITLGALLQDARPYLPRLLGLMLVFMVTIGAFSMVMAGIQIVGAVLTMGMAAMCLAPLSYLIYPFMYAALVWLELAETAIVVDGATVQDALRSTWNLMNQNRMNLLVVALVLYLGIGMIATVFVMPLILPMVALPFALIESENVATILLISGLCSIAYLPIYAVIQGIVLVFTKSAWVLTYRQLAVNPVPVIADSGGKALPDAA